MKSQTKSQMEQARWLNRMKQARDQCSLIRIDRKPLDNDYIDGYISGLSGDYVIINLLDGGVFINGFSVVRIGDIRQYRILVEHQRLATYALALKKERIAVVKRTFVNLSDIIRWFMNIYPLITIHRENIDREHCYVGSVKLLTDMTICIKKISPNGVWQGVEQIRLQDITRIDFGQKYEESLWMVAEYLRKRRSNRVISPQKYYLR